MDLEGFERKYAKVLLKHCLRVKPGKPLLIKYELNENKKFVSIVIQEAMKLGVSSINIDGLDMYERRELLLNSTTEEIKKLKLGSRESWDDVIKDGGEILILNTYTKDCTKGVSKEKMRVLRQNTLESAPLYFAGVTKYAFSWCIGAVPNLKWAKELFPNDRDALEKLWIKIFEMCMIDRFDPMSEWKVFIEKNNEMKEKLNSLDVRSLHYKNSLGTDLTLSYPKDNRWINMDKSLYNNNVGMVNFPSYEIFSTPKYDTTNGVVYSSKPLICNGHKLENFGFKFKDGKVVEIIGNDEAREVLSELLKEDRFCYLGETALVEVDSPINQTGLIYNNTLFDENASCHLALGDGFPLTLENGDKMTDQELIEKGINRSNAHMDFMVGTNDLDIEAETNNGKKLIFKKGKFNI